MKLLPLRVPRPASGKLGSKVIESRMLRIVCALALALGGVGVGNMAAPNTALAAQTFLSLYLEYDNDQFIANMNDNKDRYLGTPYSIPKRLEGPGKHMDCSSFVGFALTEQAGIDPDFWASLATSGEPSGWPGTESLDKAFTKWGIESQTYTSVASLLQDGFATKGDIVFVWPQSFGSAPENGGKSHVGFFWGDSPSDNKMWHSTHDSPSGADGNVITGIEGKVSGKLYYRVYKTAPEPGWIDLAKASSNTEVTQGNGCYSLKGAEYGIFSDSKCTKQVGTLTTDKTGATGTSDDLLPGTYYVKELKASKGYALDETVYKAVVASNEVTHVNGGSVLEVPQTDIVDLLLAKHDRESGGSSPLGMGTLAEAQFTVSYYDGYYSDAAEAEASGEPVRSWVLATDAKGQVRLDAEHKVSGDDFFTNENGRVVLPLGTVTIKETLPPVGYEANGKTFVRQITSEGNGQTVKTFSPLSGDDAVTEQAKRGDITFTKRDADTKEAMAGVLFRVTSKTTGESHVIVTDDEGVYSSAASFAKHTENTNGNDDVVKLDATDAKASAECGTWFGTTQDGATVKPNDELGAFPYDTYSIEELPCEANEGRQLVTVTVTVTGDEETVDLGYVDDPVAAIRTTASNGDDGGSGSGSNPGSSCLPEDDEVTIVDKVAYEGLIPDQTYTLEGKVIDLASKDTLATATESFEALSESGDISMVFVLSTLGLGNGSTVCFETLRDSNGRVIATHEDLNDVGQQCHVVGPTLGTTLTDDADGDHQASNASTVSLTDTVEYAGLVPGKTYEIKGQLQQKVVKDGKAAGIPLLDASGNEVTAGVTFTPEKSGGTVTLTYQFDASALESCQIVAFETLYLGERELVAHADINDDSQTVDMVEPSMTTLLREKDVRNGHTAITGKGTQLEDVVSYDNLQPGTKMRVVSLLFDVTDGAPLMAQQPQGTNDDAKQEFLAKMNAALGISGRAGTFDYPAFKQLIAGSGELAEALAWSETTFTPKEGTGSKTIAFKPFDSRNLANHTIVAFEVLMADDAERICAVELDTANASQQMSFAAPELRTLATDPEDDDHNVVSGTDCLVVDAVTFKNLGYPGAPEQTFTLEGVLMDKATGEPVYDEELGEPVSATMEFTAEDPTEGIVEVEFGPFDSSAYAGGQLVVFERLYDEDGTLVASHEDLESEDQTINVDAEVLPAEDTPLGDFAKTGSTILLPLAAGLALLAAAGSIAFFTMRRMRGESLESKMGNALRK